MESPKLGNSSDNNENSSVADPTVSLIIIHICLCIWLLLAVYTYIHGNLSLPFM